MSQLKVRTIFQGGKNENTRATHKTTKKLETTTVKKRPSSKPRLSMKQTDLSDMLVTSTYFTIQYVQARISAQPAKNPELFLTL